MLCSISTSKSTSNWLDRLRSSKGFPTSNHINLEQFLSNQTHNNNSNSTQSDQKTVIHQNQTKETPLQNGEKEWFGVISNVLAELFYMGDEKDFSRINGKKTSRKQPNPKICVVSSATNVENSPSDDVPQKFTTTDGHEQVPGPALFTSDQKMIECEDVNIARVDGEEGEKVHVDLSAFSKTEVTVIDTSCDSWKFEKMLFRRKNVWKVRDKKCKVMNVERKKRKGSLLNENGGGEKKPKVSFVQCSSGKIGNEEDKTLSNEGHDLSNKLVEAGKKTQDILRQFPQKRLSRKLKKGSSSVILIKSIPTSKTSKAGITKNCLKPTQLQYKS